MFSPYYRRALRRAAQPADVDPEDHSAINVALYGAGGHRWAMTERRRGSVERSGDHLRIGASELHWTGDALTLVLDERTVPWPSPLRGCIRLLPTLPSRHVETLADGHHWTPLAPSARVEVLLDAPSLRWRGHGYLDGNDGDAPLETAMQRWHWSRSPLRDGGALLHYDCEPRHGRPSGLSLRFGRDGRIERLPPAAAITLPRSGWRIDRRARGDAALVDTLEDTPFYARSTIATTAFGERTIGVHESLDLGRFTRPLVQWMLPFRMPRARR